MPRKLFVTAVVELPDDRWEAAGITFRLSVPWQAVCKQLDDAGIQYTTQVSEIEERARAVRKPRKPRVVAPTEAAAA